MHVPKHVVFVGQGHWARVLAESLEKRASDRCRSSIVALDSARAALAALRLFRGGIDVVVRVGFRPAARTWRGRFFDVIWRAVRMAFPRRRYGFYWIGTDVLSAVADFEAGPAGSASRLVRLARESVHIAGAPWLCSELSGIGIQSTFVPIPLPYTTATVEPFQSERFTVMSYIPDRRREFYGWSVVMECARRMPSAEFLIVGGTGSDLLDVPENVRFLGWVTEMDTVYARSHVVVRLPQHDALGGTALEALAHGRECLYSYPLETCHYVRAGDADAAYRVLRALEDRFEAGSLTPNIAGREMVSGQFDPAVTVPRLAAVLCGDDAS